MPRYDAYDHWSQTNGATKRQKMQQLWRRPKVLWPTPAIPSSKLNIGLNQWLFLGKVAVCVAQTPSTEAFLITSARQGAQRGGNYINMGNCLQCSNLANVTRRLGCHVWWAVEVHLLMIELLNLWYYARCVLIQHRLTYRAIAAAEIVPIVSVKS